MNAIEQRDQTLRAELAGKSNEDVRAQRDELLGKAGKVVESWKGENGQVDIEKADGLTGDRVSRHEEFLHLQADLNTVADVLRERDSLESAERNVKAMQAAAGMAEAVQEQTPEHVREIVVERGAAQSRRFASLGEILVDAHLNEDGEFDRTLASQKRDINLGRGFAEGMAHGGRFNAALLKESKTGTETGWDPEIRESGRIEDEHLLRRRNFYDVLPRIPVSVDGYKYVEVTPDPLSNDVATRAEGAVVAEASMNFTTAEEPIKNVGVMIPATEEQLADVPALQAFVTNKLSTMMYQEMDEQLLAGNGTGSNISGLVNRSLTDVAQGSGTKRVDVFRDVLAGIKAAELRGKMATHAIMHSDTYYNLLGARLTDNSLILGADPRTATGMNTIMGLGVIRTEVQLGSSASARQLIVGDFSARNVALLDRQDVQFRMFDQNADDATKLIVRFRFVSRLGFVVFDPASITNKVVTQSTGD